MITEVTAVTHFTTKQCMSRWTRAHADSTGINWSVQAGPGGTMIIVEHAQDRSTLEQAPVAPVTTRSAASSVQSWAS